MNSARQQIRDANAIAVGIDGGGSSTRVVAQTFGGEVLFRGQSGASNLLTTARPALISHLSKAVAGCPKPSVVCGCFAGLLLPQHRHLAIELLGELFPDSQIFAEPDYAAALFASKPLADVAVIAGTGSIVCSFDGKRFHKSGGGGYLLGDIGSGYYMGRELIALYVAGRIELSEPLRQALLDQFATIEPVEVVCKLYGEPRPAQKLAKFSDVVAVMAMAGNEAALSIIRNGMSGLANVAAAHIREHIDPNVHTGPLRVALAGGVWKSSPLTQANFTTSLNTELQQLDGKRLLNRSEVLCQVELLQRPPVMGAVELAIAYASKAPKSKKS